MKRVGGFLLVFFLLMPLPSLRSARAGGGLPQLQRNLSRIICDLLACHAQTREQRFLEMAIHFGAIKTHPIFGFGWGRQQEFAAMEQKLLRATSQFRSRFDKDGCTSAESERDLWRLAQKYIRTTEHSFITPYKKAAWNLPDGCGIGLIQKRLSAGQILLKYVLLDDRLLLFFICADQAGFIFLPVSREQIVAMINRLSEPLDDFTNGRVDYLRIHFDMELAHRLFNVLLKNLAERFPQADELFIIPDGELFKLPFEALVTGFNEKFQQDDVLFSEYQAADYVVQKFKVSYFFSYADFLRDFPGQKKYPYTLAAFGHPLVTEPVPDLPSLGGRGISTVADIPSSRLEILGLEKLFAHLRRRIFLGADFNRDNFTRFAPQAKLIHLATHFFIDDADPSRSAFLFSSTKGKASLCDAKQILKLRLQAELVILSACETSEKDLMGFKLLSGMTAAIRQAGARDLIASLWSVDEFSSQIVPLFYGEYLRLGRSAAALRNAKLVLMDKTIFFQDGIRLSLAHPFLWADYVLYHFCR
jgi:CHAT domain-containing protein